ncbi:MAG: ORF6N domain-containing protein [Elusimicrobiota bacterium]
MPEAIEGSILLIRGRRVMLDRDLAALYGVPTKQLNRAVKRHERRFPADFMFQMNPTEFKNWRCQFGTSNPRLKMGLRRRPYLFTEQGVAMLSSVLNSERAILVNITIMRAFVRIKETLFLHQGLSVKLKELERRIEGHDDHIRSIFDAIRELMAPDPKDRKRIGFEP